ncbi:ABC1 kinase family protein [Paludifilum halophilum]|uniref:ABC transporter n=1 Tax=Paludifilum halophilum TaxID=1642702 RepID=A0A235B9Q6_9BACL|nr:AarF/ABC1/UbiB kinase family protein [Paludifilum halophilum]OYD09040.1 ABC transporter [Paludifilum halophilum]
MFGRKMRNLNRYREIALTLTRHGFGYILDEMGIFTYLSIPKKESKPLHRDPATRGRHIRQTLEELGPTFIKLGQVASTRTDLLPEDIIRELEKLHDDVRPLPFEEIRTILEQELGEISDHFAEIEETAIAAASIGQVHRAILYNGDTVAVKVQRPRISTIIETDLSILRDIAALAEQRVEWAEQHQVSEVVEELARSVQEELDYTSEARHADKIRKQFTEEKHLYIPPIYWNLTTSRVLTMEYIHGIKLTRLESLDQMGFDRKILAERLIRALFHQILIEGFFHGDPHPGNIFAQPGNRLAFIDFGMVGRLTPEMQDHFASMVIAMMRRDTDGVVQAVLKMGLVPDDVDIGQLWLDTDELTDKYYDIALSEVSLGEVVNDLFDVAYRHRVRIPSDLTLLGKTMITLESIVKKLDPEIHVTQITQPFGEQLLKRRYNPRRMATSAWKNLLDYGETLMELPKQLKELSESIKRGRIQVDVGVPRLNLFLRKLDQIVNRLSYSIVLLSFSIIMCGLIIGSSLTRQQTLLWKVPAIEIGFVIALFMLLWLIYSIYKSGRL